MARFEDAVAQLISRMQQSAAILIVYHRDETSVTLDRKAWVGRTPFRISDQGNSRLIWSDRDFLIPVADLVIGGSPVEPRQGDWIEQIFTPPADTMRFELMAPEGEPVWRHSDPQKLIYRIHTKRVVHS